MLSRCSLRLLIPGAALLLALAPAALAAERIVLAEEFTATW